MTTALSNHLFPDFQYAIDDEPTRDWTVEEFFQWKLMQTYKMMDDKYHLINDDLRHNLAQAEEKLRSTFVTLAAVTSTATTATTEGVGGKGPVEKITTTATSTEPVAATVPVPTIHLQVLKGPHQGQTFDVQPVVHKFCGLGRGRGKKLVEHGVSLHLDFEVSTNHGKFCVNDKAQDGKVYFVDTESSNGTRHDNIDLVPHEPVEIVTKSRLECGQSVLEVTLIV